MKCECVFVGEKSSNPALSNQTENINFLSKRRFLALSTRRAARRSERAAVSSAHVCSDCGRVRRGRVERRRRRSAEAALSSSGASDRTNASQARPPFQLTHKPSGCECRRKMWFDNCSSWLFLWSPRQVSRSLGGKPRGGRSGAARPGVDTTNNWVGAGCARPESRLSHRDTRKQKQISAARIDWFRFCSTRRPQQGKCKFCAGDNLILLETNPAALGGCRGGGMSRALYTLIFYICFHSHTRVDVFIFITSPVEVRMMRRGKMGRVRHAVSSFLLLLPREEQTNVLEESNWGVSLFCI